MNKSYSRINWENYTSTNTPLNATNLNKMDLALNTVDDRVVSLDTTKTDLSVSQGLVKNITFNENTGVFTITFLNGSTSTIDTMLEKIAINFDYDATTQKLIITLQDGTKKYIDLSALITIYEFSTSSTIDFTVDSNGKVSANIIDGSIGSSKLNPDYLAQINASVEQARVYKENASDSADDSQTYANNAQTSAYEANSSKESAEAAARTAANLLSSIEFQIDTDGHLYYKTDNDNITFRIDEATGKLQFKITT